MPTYRPFACSHRLSASPRTAGGQPHSIRAMRFWHIRHTNSRTAMGGLHVWVAACCVAILGACASAPSQPTNAPSPVQAAPASGLGGGSATVTASLWAQSNLLPLATANSVWTHRTVGSRPRSDYSAVEHAGRPALLARSQRGDSWMQLALQYSSPTMGRLRFSWFVDALNTQADLADRSLDDAVARVILQFEDDRSRFSMRDNLLSELVQLATGEPLPYATLMYVWDHRYPAGTVIAHTRTDRIKLMVVESGAQRLGQWVDIERDVRADYETAFGKPPKVLKGIALMTDSNNTLAPAQAWFGPLRWSASDAPP